MSNIAIHIETIFGENQYRLLLAQSNKSKEISPEEHERFKIRCNDDYEKMSKYLTYFLEDESMIKKYKMDDEDSVGWKICREMSDMVASLKYFSTGRA